MEAGEWRSSYFSLEVIVASAYPPSFTCYGGYDLFGGHRRVSLAAVLHLGASCWSGMAAVVSAASSAVTASLHHPLLHGHLRL